MVAVVRGLPNEVTLRKGSKVIGQWSVQAWYCLNQFHRRVDQMLVDKIAFLEHWLDPKLLWSVKLPNSVLIYCDGLFPPVIFGRMHPNHNQPMGKVKSFQLPQNRVVRWHRSELGFLNEINVREGIWRKRDSFACIHSPLRSCPTQKLVRFSFNRSNLKLKNKNIQDCLTIGENNAYF